MKKVAFLFVFLLSITFSGSVYGWDEGDKQTAVAQPPLSIELWQNLIQADGRFPPHAQLQHLFYQDGQLVIQLAIPHQWLNEQLTEESADELVMALMQMGHPFGVRNIDVQLADKNGRFVPLNSFLPPLPPLPPLPVSENQLLPPPNHPLPGQGQPVGALSGKTVWISAGHGWEWSTALTKWRTQRTTTFGIVEDFASAEAVDQYLVNYLWNAGATVWLVRERGMNPYEIIVDNDDGPATYSETGSWSTSGTPGYNGLTYRFATATTGSATATATWTPNLPVAGWYPVWVWYLDSTNRAYDARFVVNHSGGTTTVSLAQEVHGESWHFLGDFYFDAGTAGSVTLINESFDNAPGTVLIADAVRFGAGMGDTDYGGGVSGRPRWEEDAFIYSAFQGFDTTGSGDVTARPRYAEWELSKGYAGEDAIYISWHTNAGGGTGSETFIYNGGATPGSAALQNAIHTELIADLQSEWGAWTDRGQKSANFGELRELSTMPGTLLEIAFHDTASDADALKSPQFRNIAARSVAQGVVKYFAIRDGVAINLAPEPPIDLFVENIATGQLSLSWNPAPATVAGGDMATSYKVYMSQNGHGFDNGTATVAPNLTVTGLNSDTTYYFKVSGINAGGESFATAVVAVHTPLFGAGIEFLLVDGFDRLDKSAMISQNDGPDLGITQRMFLERMNRFDYTIEHGSSLAACGFAFDGAVNEVVINGYADLADYPAVDWYVGEDGTADNSLDGAERLLLSAYLDGNGRLLISGAELAYDLARPTFGEDPAFYQNYLKATYVGDDANSYSFVGVGGGPFAGLSGSFDDSTQGYYDVAYPDRIAATGGSSVIVNYNGGWADGAAVLYTDSFRVANIGFPLETITNPVERNNLICAIAMELMSGPATCTAPAPALLVTNAMGNDLQLDWGSVSGAERYELFNDGMPYFSAGSMNMQTAVFAPTVTNTISNALLVGDMKQFYLLLAGTDCAGLGLGSNEVGYFNFTIVAGS